MKIPFRLASPRAAVMIFVLLVVVAGAVVLAGWAHLIASRTHFTEETGLAISRRISLHNARALVDQWVRVGVAAGSVNATVCNFTVSGTNWGNFRVADGATNTLTASNTFAWSGLMNPFSPLGAAGYVTNLSAIITQTNRDRQGTLQSVILTRSYAVRSRSPLGAGYPLVLHTNSAATNFSKVAIATNTAPALVYAEPAGQSTAPVSPTYFAPAVRTVLATSNVSPPPSEMIEFPFVPLTSGVSGYGGQLDSPLARTLVLSNPSAAASTAFPAPPTVMDILKGDGSSEYRVVGQLPSGILLQAVNFAPVSTAHGPSSLLLFGPTPDQAPQQTGVDRIKYFYFGHEFEVRYNSTSIQYGVDPAWSTLNADTQAIVFNSDGSVNTSVMSGSITVGAQRAIIFVPVAGALITYSSTAVHFEVDFLSSGVSKAAVYRPSEYFQPGGVAFLLVPGPTVGGGFSVGNSILSRLVPPLEKGCDLADGMRLAQLKTDGTTYDINDNNGQPLIWLRPTLSPPFLLAAESSSADPVLHYISSNSTTVANGTPIVFRRWLGIFDSSLVLDPANSASSMLFGFLDQGPATLGLESGTNERLTALEFSNEAGGLTLRVPASGNWNLSATFPGTPVDIVSEGNPTIVGGFRTDRNMSVSTNSISVLPDPSGAALEPLLDRVGWIESWQQ